jgi:low affinity Fe/Cu permease
VVENVPAPSGLNGERSLAYRIGCRVSAWVSDLSAHPYAQLGVVVFCVAWFALGLSTDLLTAALSILAISLSQMVLNRQNEREAEAHRRDVAMHAKLDELIISVRHAHNDMAGIEDLPEEVIVELKEENLQKLSKATDEPDEAHRRMPGDATRSRRGAI